MLNRNSIVTAAIDLIEREGADALSMRRIAAELGVAVMSLYNHIPNKSALLDAVAETVMSRFEFTDDPAAHWTDRVRWQARAFRQMAQRYPHSTLVVMSRPKKSSVGLIPVELALATMREAGFEGREAAQMLHVFIGYVVGSLLREVGVTPSFAPVRGDDTLAKADPELFPNITELASYLTEYDHDEEFEFGLELFIQAMTARIRERAGESDVRG